MSSLYAIPLNNAGSPSMQGSRPTGGHVGASDPFKTANVQLAGTPRGVMYSRGISNPWDAASVAPHGLEMVFDYGLMDRDRYQAGQGVRNMASPYQAAGAQNLVEQQNMLAMLRGAAEGNAPSQAQLMMQSGLDQGIASQAALMAGQRGGNVGATQRMIGDQAGAARQGMLRDAGAQRAAEMATARGQYGSALQNFQNQVNAMTQYYVSLGYSLDEADRAAQMQLANSQVTAATGRAAAQAADTQNIMQGVGSGVSAVASMIPLMTSDERAKRKVSSDGKEVRALLNAIKPAAFDYKNAAKHGAGRHVGVMAQDLEKTAAGRAMVREIGGVKHVDVRRAALAALSAAADVHKRLEKVEHAR